MGPANAINEKFLALMRAAADNPQLTLVDAQSLPFAQEFLDCLQPSPSVASAGSVRALIDSTAGLHAAISDTFTLDELQKPDENERLALLDNSDIVMVDGQRRLRLRESVRAEILAATKPDDLRQTLRTASDQDQNEFDAITRDPVRLPSAWMRSFLLGEFADLDKTPLPELRAARAARERLRLVEDLPTSVPDVAELERRESLAELLEPLRVLVGAKIGWDGEPVSDRFVGRKQELASLRAFVDELDSESLLEGGSRMVTRVWRGVTGSTAPTLMMIVARGGLGKSTLLAKFVLDHALHQSTPFPFVYLDFDRASLDPERPLQILVEMSRQVLLQFPASSQALEPLIADLRDRLSEKESAVSSADPYWRFVQALQQHATFGRRAFLLILDTLETVQWNDAAVNGLSELIRQLRDKGLTELRVVASGRADVPQFQDPDSKKPELIELGPLNVSSARAMATALGQSCLGTEWNPDWSTKIAGATSDDGARREPLAIRVAVDLIAAAETTAIRSQLADEILAQGLDSSDDFVARLYEKRIVNHVRNPLAKKLAWPGLVVRRVDVEIIQDLLAGMCDLDFDQADNAYRALRQEVWMVNEENGVLKHRPDLRARTLPLMKRKDPDRFAAIAAKAVEFFAKRKGKSDQHYAEWIYHRLLNGESPDDVDRDVDAETLKLLGLAEEDFFALKSPAAGYLAARTARRRLSRKRLNALDPVDALYHLSARSPRSFAFDDTSVDESLQRIARSVDPSTTQVPDNLIPWALALRIKTGIWQDVGGEHFSGQQPAPVHYAFSYWLARTLRSHRDVSLSVLEHQRETLPALVQLMAAARLTRAKEFRQLDEYVASVLQQMQPMAAPSIQAALRTAIVLGDLCRAPALRLWLASRRRSAGLGLPPSISLRELHALIRMHPESEQLLSSLDLRDVNAPLRLTDDRIVLPVLQVLEEQLSSDHQPRLDSVSQVFSLRDEDWIIPFGYAAARAFGSGFTGVMTRRMKGFLQAGLKRGRDQDAALPGDMLGAMQLADEAGDLPGFARLVLTESDPDDSASDDLKQLLECRDAWAESIDLVCRFGDIQPQMQQLDPSDRPPPPGPVIHRVDLQKGRWGGKSFANGRSVRAVLESVEKDVFYYSVIVESTDGSPLKAPVVFHLHDSYPRSVVTIRRIDDHQKALLTEWNAYGVFVVGVQVKDNSGNWIGLECDLAQLPQLPKRFLKR